MVNLVSSATALGLAAVIIGALILMKRFDIKLTYVTKPAAVSLFLLAFFRYLYVQPPIYYIKGLSDPASPFNTVTANPTLTALAVILVWFSYAAILTTVLSAFFNYKTLRRIVNFFSLPMFAIMLIFFETYAIASVGAEAYALPTKRVWIMVIEIGLGIAIAAGNSISDKKFEFPKTLSDIGNLLLGLVFAIIAIMPCYVPQAFFTSIDPMIKLYDLTPEHRIMLYGSVIIPILIFHCLKNKPVEVNRMILLYMSLAFLWVYIGRWNFEDLQILEIFKPETWPLTLDSLQILKHWPLHLCNTAMFLYPLCLTFNFKKLFNFCLFINVLGALFAMVIPTDLGGLNAIGTERISFWLNHYAAFFMPLLMISLKVFKRPKFKQWIYAMITLIVYFAAMLFLNAATGSDFFFLNSDFIVSKLGLWAEQTRELTWVLNIQGHELVFYPIYQALFVSVYVALSIGVWFLYAILFTILDAGEDRRKREKDYRKMKKDLKKYLGNKASTTDKGNNPPSLVLSHFSKRYGSNKHYSVNDVSFEVKGGEIFGFLGPNGAGKSTIIKSMVGIQTITSGNIEICGFDVEKQSVEAKLNTAFVPDHYALYENLTGREYINYIADLFEVSQQDRDEFINKYVDLFQLTGAFDNQMKTYSHGMKQKITIMSALVHNPKVWILDEPLTGLDPTSIHEVKECMKEHAAKGNIVFFSSHIIDVVEKLCDKIAIIKKGQLRAFTSMQELNDQGIDLEQYYLSIIYDGNDEHVPYVEPDAEAEAATV